MPSAITLEAVQPLLSYLTISVFSIFVLCGVAPNAWAKPIKKQSAGITSETAISRAPRVEEITSESITIIPIENSDSPTSASPSQGGYDIPRVIPVDGSPIQKIRPHGLGSDLGPESFQGLLEAVPMTEKMDGTPVASRQELEVLMSRALLAFYARKYDDAKSGFQDVIAKNPNVFLAHEFLAQAHTVQGDYTGAILQYQRSERFEPQARKGAIYFYIGDLYIRLQRYSAAQKYFEAARDRGAFPVATRYYLGFLAYRQDLWREAHAYFYEARAHLAESKSAYDRELEQPIHFYLAQIDLRLGFPRYALKSLYEISKLQANKPTLLKRQGWALEEALDQPVSRATLLLFMQYDTNVAGFSPGHEATPQSVSRRSGIGEVAAADVSMQTSPSRPWAFGGELTTAVNRHEDTELAALDSWTNVPSLWVSWWNSKDLELRLRYDYSNTLLDRDSYKLFLQTHGPALSASYFWDEKQKIDFAYSFRFNRYPGDFAQGPSIDEQRSGYEHQFSVRYGISSPTPDWQPYAQYAFNDTHTEGRNFIALAHTLEVGSGYWIKNIALATASFAYTRTGFPSHLTGRADNSFYLRLQAQLPLTDNWSLLSDFWYFTNASSLPGEFTYSRLQFNAGATYTFGF